ncbi:type II toxin-antitoxin system RelE/ParE family toxin [Salipiger aestuarii]|uniref:type II toxin-antitoxin system RelE/ParE family toxin n=1 Tax=Salipiger aestuarii TaxID=568098 RepID=UPI002880A880|nr:type II toxin-antitoxin system RelE/ParE family toxin [Salipiger aestuarii]
MLLILASLAAPQPHSIAARSSLGCTASMSESSSWVILPAAETDLSDIWRHGAGNCGIAQADRYTDGLFALFDLLADFPEMARERGEFTSPVRIHPSGVHLVIYRADGQGGEIIRILHAHQNLSAYLLEG